MESRDRRSHESEVEEKLGSKEIFYIITHLVLVPINVIYYITVWILMSHKTLILIPIIISIIVLSFQCLCAFATMGRFKGNLSDWYEWVFTNSPIWWVSELLQESVKSYYIWYNVVWVLSCLCIIYTLLALPIDGYSKYTTEEILLVYAYILMAYWSTVIYYISFLCERHGSLIKFCEDWNKFFEDWNEFCKISNYCTSIFINFLIFLSYFIVIVINYVI